MRPLKFRFAGLFFLVFLAVAAKSQTGASIQGKFERTLQDYQDFSALGRSGSAFIDETTIASFKNLFEMDANYFWDLYPAEVQRIPHLLTIEEYVDRVQRVFGGRKPLISYGKHHLVLNSSGRTAIAYMRKSVYVQNKRDTTALKLNKTRLNLRLLLNVRKDTVLIQNITEDTRLARIRSLGVAGCWYFAGKISGGFFSNPVTGVNPEKIAGYSIGNQTGYQVGLNMDIRVNRKSVDGLLINVGLFYSRTGLTTRIDNYVHTSRQVFDPGANPFEITVFDRSSEVVEKTVLTGISVPVTVKWFIMHRLYLKAGPMFSLVSGISRAACTLSHTGGGKVMLVNELSLPETERKWFYLDETHEMDDARYGFFRSREIVPSASEQAASINVALVFAVGFEARIGNFTAGIEPVLNLGLTQLTQRPGMADYNLDPAGTYCGFLQTFRSLRINSIGITLNIGNLFSR